MSLIDIESSPSILVYDWSGWKGYLLSLLFPEATRIKAVPGETAGDILLRLQHSGGTWAFHIDLTDSSLWPLDRATLCHELQDRGVTILNANITNISKRYVQAVCRQSGLNVAATDRDGDQSELLIVKTNRNSGGHSEYRLSPEVRHQLGIRDVPFSNRPDHGYMVMPRERVPDRVWSDPTLVVERYIDNGNCLFYRVYVLGCRVAISEGSESALVKTIGRAQRRRLLLFTRDRPNGWENSIPEDLKSAVRDCLRFIEAASLDFGCLDMLRDSDGKFYIVDMNSTPHWGAESEFRIIDFLLPDAARS